METSNPTVHAANRPRSVLRRVLQILVGTIALLVGSVILARTAESGALGSPAQNWIRQQKARLAYNHLYGMDQPPFRLDANEYLVKVSDSLSPGDALDIAAGQGRNALYLAKKGWRVTGFDVSEKGLEVARRNAESAGLSVTLERANWLDFEYGKERWDLVMLVYAPIPHDDGGFRQRITDSIKPGGHLLIVTPVMMHQAAEIKPRIPGDLENGELPRLWPDLEILEFSEQPEKTDFFNMDLPVARLLARKR